MQVTESNVDSQSESVIGQQSNSHAIDQLTKTECTSSSNKSEDRTENVGTKSAESAENVDDADGSEASVDGRDSEHKAESEAEREGEGKGMELEEKGEVKAASMMETDMQRKVEDTGKTDGAFRTSTEKDKVHVSSSGQCYVMYATVLVLLHSIDYM